MVYASVCFGLLIVSTACGARSSAGDDAPASAGSDEPSATAGWSDVSKANAALLNDLCALVQATECRLYDDQATCVTVFASDLDTAERNGCAAEQLDLLRCRREHGVRCTRGTLLRWNDGCEVETYGVDECF